MVKLLLCRRYEVFTVKIRVQVCRVVNNVSEDLAVSFFRVTSRHHNPKDLDSNYCFVFGKSWV
jgi:hypothetical protein